MPALTAAGILFKPCQHPQEVLYSLILNSDAHVLLTSLPHAIAGGSRLKRIYLWLEVLVQFWITYSQESFLENQTGFDSPEALMNGERCDVG